MKKYRVLRCGDQYAIQVKRFFFFWVYIKEYVCVAFGMGYYRKSCFSSELQCERFMQEEYGKHQTRITYWHII